MNAVLHGNFGLDSELRDTLEGLASMHQAIDARLGLAHVARLAVCMQARWTERMLIITIEDSGAGFSPDGVVIVGNGLPADHRARGRGLMILNTLCDGIDFSHGGCVIELTFRL